MKLSQILKGVKVLNTYDDIEVTDVTQDSRLVKEGFLFVCVKGAVFDGHSVAAEMLDKGAAAVVVERDLGLNNQILVENSRADFSPICANFYGNPAEKLKLIGLTGTNGKTTTTFLIKQILENVGKKVGLIGTVQNMIGDEVYPAKYTTPDPYELQKLFAMMVEAECEYCVMEVSSQALAQGRVNGLRFAVGAFTNLTQDHLDYHKTVENYLKAKKKFFDDMPKNAFSLTNLDDKNGLVMTQNTRSKVYTYSLRSLSDFKGRVLESHFEGMLLDFNNHELAVQFIGKFNASNLLAVFGAAVLLGKKEEEVLVALSTLHPVAGRFDAVRSPKGVTAIVDYAHTPDALINVLNAIHGVLEGKGKVITVVGAGGNRDKGKRPIMAKEAAKASDRVIITSDNPRFEEPQDIINDMLAGLDAEDMKKTLSIADRKEAIRTACMLAEKGDVILVAGKGHENYQEIKGVKHHFDDKEVLKEVFQ